MRQNTVAAIGGGVLAGLAMAMLGYQLVPEPPKPVLSVTCFESGEQRSITAKSALVMTGEVVGEGPYASLTVAADNIATQTFAEGRMFCGISPDEGKPNE